MVLRDPGPEQLKAFQVQIDRPAADGAAAGLGNARVPDPGQQRTHDDERRAHTAYQFIRRLIGRDGPRIQGQGVIFAGIHLDAQIFQDATNRANVFQLGNLVEMTRRLAQDRSGNNRQHGVLRATSLDSSDQPVAAFDNQLLHSESSCVPQGTNLFSVYIDTRCHVTG